MSAAGAEMSNGDLLRIAEDSGFDVMITTDEDQYQDPARDKAGR